MLAGGINFPPESSVFVNFESPAFYIVQWKNVRPPPLPRTNRTCLAPPLVLSGHVASLTLPLSTRALATV